MGKGEYGGVFHHPVKLSKRVNGADPRNLEDAVKEVIGWFLERENALEDLRQNVPELHETLTNVISRHASRLLLCGPPSEGSELCSKVVDEGLR